MYGIVCFEREKGRVIGYCVLGGREGGRGMACVNWSLLFREIVLVNDYCKGEKLSYWLLLVTSPFPIGCC